MNGGRGILAAGVVMAAACAAGGQMRVMGGHRSPDGTTVQMGAIEPDPQKELAQLQAVCQEKTAAAQGAMGKGLWAEALNHLDEAQRYCPSPGQLQTIRQLYEAVEAEAKFRLGAADALMREGQYEEGLAAYESIGRTFGLLPSAAQARRRLAEASKDPAIRQAIQQAKAERMMRELQAILAGELAPPGGLGPVAVSRIKELPETAQDRAMELLERIAYFCPDCPAGQAAGNDLTALMGDKAFYDAYLARRQAKQAQGVLATARQLRQAGRLDRALVLYRRIGREFPQTPAAARAKTEAQQVEELLAVEKATAP